MYVAGDNTRCLNWYNVTFHESYYYLFLMCSGFRLLNCLPLLCVSRSGVTSRQRPLHACAVCLPWRLLHVLPGPNGGWQRGEHISSHLRWGLQPLRQHAAHTRGRTWHGDAFGSPPQWFYLQQRWGEGVRGEDAKGRAGSRVWTWQESTAYG